MNKIIVWLIVLFSLSTLVIGALDNSGGYWSMDDDDTSGTVAIDASGFSRNGTLTNGVTSGQVGLLREAYYFKATDTEYVDLSAHYSDFSGDTSGTISAWIKTNGTTQMSILCLSVNVDASSEACLLIEVGLDDLFWGVRDDGAYRGNSPHTSTGANLKDDSWHHVVVTVDLGTTTTKLYIDGQLNYTDAADGNWLSGITAADSLNIGANEDSGGTQWYWDGLLDEVGYWNRSLNSTEVSELYNNGLGNNPYGVPVFPGDDTLNITVPNPVDPSQFNVATVNINLSINSTYDFNCSLYINSTLNESTTGLTATSNYYLNYTKTFADGEWEYFVNCYNNETNGNTTPSTIYVDTSSPTYVTNFVNNSLYYKNLISGYFNFTDNIILSSFNLSIDGVKKNTTLIAKKDYNFNFSFTPSDYANGLHTMTIRIADGHTAKKLLGEYYWSNGLFNDYLDYKVYSGDHIRVKSKDKSLFDDWSTQKKKDRYNQIFKPAKPSDTIVLIEESDMPIYILEKEGYYGDQWIITGDHWKDYVLKGEPNARVSIERIDLTTVEVTITGITNNPERLEFESIGDLNIVTHNYTFGIMGVTESYTNHTIDGFSNTLYFNVTGAENITPTVILEINNTNYTIPYNSFQTNLIQFNKTVFNNYNITGRNSLLYHQWYFNLTGSTFENTDEQYQVLWNVDLGTCSGIRNYSVFNMSYYDEKNNSVRLDVKNEYDFTVFDGTYYYNQTGKFEGNTSDTFCTTLDPRNVTYNWNLWGDIVTLSKEGYATRILDLDEAFPTTISNKPQTNLSLYLIKLNDSATITYNWFTTEFQAIDGVMRIYRCGSNENILVESVPITGGVAIANVELLNQPYSYEVIVGGRLYRSETGFSKCHVEANTEVTYYVEITQPFAIDLIGLHSIYCNLTQPTNNTVKMQWEPNPEEDGYVQGCIIAYRNSVAGSTEVYNNCSSVADGYSREVAVPLSGFSYTIMGELRQNNQTAFCSNTITLHTSENAAQLFSFGGLFAVFILVASLILFYAGDGEVQVIAAGIGLVIAWSLGLLNFGFITSSAIVSILIIVVGVGRYSRR